jgi:hypothetical protein
MEVESAGTAGNAAARRTADARYIMFETTHDSGAPSPTRIGLTIIYGG